MFLTSGECHSSTAFLVVIRHVIDPRADGITWHHAGTASLTRIRISQRRYLKHGAVLISIS
jgi:hypothetical protein